MEEQFIESSTAWFMLCIASGVCICFFFNIILNLKNREINDLKKQISIEVAKKEAYKLKDFEMIELQNENESLKKELVSKEKEIKDLKLKEESHKEAFEKLLNFCLEK